MEEAVQLANKLLVQIGELKEENQKLIKEEFQKVINRARS
jgi:hypothetical protein